jgi:hypothetical protein
LPPGNCGKLELQRNEAVRVYKERSKSVVFLLYCELFVTVV